MTPRTLFLKFKLCPMNSSMFSIIFTKLKILYSIVISFLIKMMNLFRRFKISPKIFFHNKTMFHYISFSSTSKRMIWNINENISFFATISASEIMRMFSWLKATSNLISILFHEKIVLNNRQKSSLLCTG